MSRLTDSGATEHEACLNFNARAEGDDVYVAVGHVFSPANPVPLVTLLQQ